MPFSLYLMRHGIAEDFDPASMKSDADRKLTKEGKDKLAEQAKGVRALDLDLGLLVTSPFTRARQTAEIVAGALDAKLPLEIASELVPNADPEQILEYLAAKKASAPTLLFGHEPHLSTLVSIVLSGKSEIAVEMKKGALVGLELMRLQPPFRGHLRFLIPPRALRGLH
ncbi:MAG: phosphohistidine phosphatase SixA [Deltaproteobacteria bacterium]|nr:phosphohistidine phosphatase SixA [Deltaproteobacteria bacterium]